MSKQKCHLAILTEAGARRIGRPDLAGETVEYDYFYPEEAGGQTVRNVWYKGSLIAINLSHGGDEPGLILVGEDRHANKTR